MHDHRMETVIVAVVETELTAQDAAHALDLLGDAGTIGLTASAIVTKSPGGAITVMKSRRALPASAMGGGAVGALIGLFTGPLGIAFGAVIGFAFGTVVDVSDLRVRRGFVASVERTLEPGKSAVIAQINEDDTGPVNQQMAALGAAVLRRDLTDVTNAQYDKEVAALQRRFTGEG
jgi:uncharacterized membrane protein